MKELLRSNDPVLLSWVEALLAGARIEAFFLDGHTAVIEGSISAISRRVMVGDEQYPAARRLLADAGHRFSDDER